MRHVANPVLLRATTNIFAQEGLAALSRARERSPRFPAPTLGARQARRFWGAASRPPLGHPPLPLLRPTSASPGHYPIFRGRCRAVRPFSGMPSFRHGLLASWAIPPEAGMRLTPSAREAGPGLGLPCSFYLISDSLGHVFPPGF